MGHRVLFCVALIVALSACSAPGYYFQAMSGQLKLMHARQDIDSLLDSPSTSPELAAQLKLAGQMTSFAHDSLDLPADGSYSSYVNVEQDALLWNVVATPEFSLVPEKWCFPVAGCVPYRGFFKQEKAQASADKLRKKGMDVVVSPATAYSTLGWFDDPLLSTMFSGPDSRLAGYLFHELAHQRLYTRDDGEFNEGYATFVEEIGVQLWLEARQQQDELEEWQRLRAVNKDFTGLIMQVRETLAELYQSSQADDVKRQGKAGIINALKPAYDDLVREKWGGRPYYRNWFDTPVNNARLALYNTYEGSHCAFLGLWQESAGDIHAFHRMAEEKSRLKKEQREIWLKQTCQSIAPRANL